MAADNGDRPEGDIARDETAGRKAKRLIGWVVGGLLLLVVLFVLFVPASFLEMRLSVLLKLGVGVFFTILLAAGLMAASFYSDASGHDEDAPR